MAGNETAGAAEDETTRSHQVIRLDIPKGYRGHVAPTEELVAASQKEPVFATGAFDGPLDGCGCRGIAACGVTASGAIIKKTGCISVTPNPDTQSRMLETLPAIIDQPKHAWPQAYVPQSVWALAMQNTPKRNGFSQFGHLFGERVVIARCGSLESHSCDALDRIADATVLEAVADQRRLKVFVLGTHKGVASCLARVNGVTEGAVLDASFLDYFGTPLTKEGGLEVMLRKIMTYGGGDFLSSGLQGSVVQALANAAAFGAAMRAVADGASPLGHAYGAVLTSSPLRCGPQDSWPGHLAEWLINVLAELAFAEQHSRPPPLYNGLSAAARLVARVAYRGGLRLKSFGLNNRSYALSNVHPLLNESIDGSITVRRKVKSTLVTEARSLVAAEGGRLEFWAVDAAADGFKRGLAAVAAAGVDVAVCGITQTKGVVVREHSWSASGVETAAEKLKESLKVVPPLQIRPATVLEFPSLPASQINRLRAGDFPENGSGCCVVCWLSGGGEMIPCVDCGAMAHVACVNGAALSETNCPFCKDAKARADLSKKNAAHRLKRKERFAAPARESSRPKRECRE